MPKATRTAFEPALVLALVLALVGEANATTYLYRAEGGKARNIISNVLHNTLNDARATTTWSSGDIIVCEAGEYLTGALSVTAANVQIYSEGCTFINTNGGGVELVGDNARWYGPTTVKIGGSSGTPVNVGGSNQPAHINHYELRDITVAECPAGATPFYIRQYRFTGGPFRTCGELVRCKVTALNTQDAFAFADFSSTGAIRSYHTMVDCEVWGANYDNISNCVSVDLAHTVRILGGRFLRSGGPNLISVRAGQGQIEVYDAEISGGFECNSNTTMSDTRYEVYGAVVDNCRIDCKYGGIMLTNGNNGSPPEGSAAYPMRATGNRVTRNAAAWSGSTGPPNGLLGLISFDGGCSTNVQIDNNYLDGSNVVTTSGSNTLKGIYASSFPAVGRVEITNNYVTGAHLGISVGGSGVLFLRNNLVRYTGGAASPSANPKGIEVYSVSSMVFERNTVVFETSATSGNLVDGGAVTVLGPRNNFFWHTVTSTPLSGYTAHGSDTTSTSAALMPSPLVVTNRNVPNTLRDFNRDALQNTSDVTHQYFMGATTNARIREVLGHRPDEKRP